MRTNDSAPGRNPLFVLICLALAFAVIVVATGCPRAANPGVGGPSAGGGKASAGAGQIASDLSGEAFRASIPEGTTLTGLDVLIAEDFERIRGSKIALLTHSAALDAGGRSALALLSQPASGCEIVHVFLPLNGYDATTPQAEGAPRDLADGRFSEVESAEVTVLDGKTPRPLAAQLAGADLVVVDLQDTGVRYSPAVSALAILMEEAYLAGRPVLVLDRPNPLGGLAVNGPIQDPARYSHPLSYYPMTISHGATIAELATLFNTFFGIGSDLEIVKMEGWSRTARWERTGRNWPPCDSAVDSAKAAPLLPAFGMLASGKFSFDVGGPLAGKAFGAPDFDAASAAASLRSKLSQADAWKIEVVQFTSRAGLHAGTACNGLRIVSLANGDPVDLALALAAVLMSSPIEALTPEQVAPYIGSAAALEALRRGASGPSLKKLYEDQIIAFQEARFKALLYDK